MARLNRTLIVTAFLYVGVVAITAGAVTPGQTSQSVPSTPARLAEMRHHFADVMLVHEAVVRGDLPAVRPPALRVAAATMPPGMPATTATYLAEIRKAGQRAAEATTLAAAAEATVAMVTGCATCHQGVGVFPVPSRPAGHDLGGIVGHMVEHQRAVDDMLIGLMVPSAAGWRRGAERLRAAPLLPREFPGDPKLTKDIRKVDLRVHELADQAIEAETPGARANAYVALLGTCSPCHGLHSKIWGPGRGGNPSLLSQDRRPPSGRVVSHLRGY